MSINLLAEFFMKSLIYSSEYYFTQILSDKSVLDVVEISEQ